MSKIQEEIIFISRPSCPHCIDFKEAIDINNIKAKLLKNDIKLIILHTDNPLHQKIYTDDYKIPNPKYVPYLHYINKFMEEDDIKYSGHEIKDRGLILNLEINNIRIPPITKIQFNNKYLKYKLKYLSAK